MALRKLTDEELSRALGEQARGALTHDFFYSSSRDCGCVAGAAENIEDGAFMTEVSTRAAWISDSIAPGYDMEFSYPESPEELLQLLADRGLT